MSDPLDISGPDRSEEPKKGLWSKLKRGLTMTHTEIIDRISAAVEGRGIVDEGTLEDLEESLIAADLGVETTLELVDRIRGRVQAGQGSDLVRLQEMLVDEISVLLLDAPLLPPAAPPLVTLVVGVNGVGKTTSIAKLARRAQGNEEKVLLVAADTFRAAAIEQLSTWGDRLGIEVIRQRQGSDPAAVVFDAMKAAVARAVDSVIVDTAGRLHTRSDLMDELSKIDRVVAREAPKYHRRTLLVLDATNGQNAVNQAREFQQAVPIDGLLLSKLDGTAKGGVVVAIARELRVPVGYLGVGEGADDLVDFNARDFARALFGG